MSDHSATARQDGMTFGIILAALEHAKHSATSARSAVTRIATYVPQMERGYSDSITERDLPELAAQFRSFADELDAAARQAAPHLREVA